MLSTAILRKTKVSSQHQSLRHIAVLFSSKAGVILIALLSHPVLARLYTPAQFGEFALLNSILAILLIGSSGRYEDGIIISRRIHQARAVFQLCQVILIGYVLILSLGSIFTPSKILLFLKEKGVPPYYLWILPFLVLFSGYWQIAHNWLIKFRKFGKISFILILQRLIIFLTAVGAAYFPIQAVHNNGLVISVFVGYAGIFAFSLFSHREPLFIPIKNLQLYAHFHRRFLFFTTPSLFISLIIQHLPILWLNYFYTREITGSYSMAYTLITLPLTGIIFSVTEVYYERLSQSSRSKQFEIIKSLCSYFTIILFPISLIGFLWGEQLTVLLLNEKWRDTGRIVSILSPTIIFQGLTNCLTLPIAIMQKQSLSLIFQFLKIILWVLALTTGFYLQDVYLSFKLMTLFSLLYFFIVGKVMYTILNRRATHYNQRTFSKPQKIYS